MSEHVLADQPAGPHLLDVTAGPELSERGGLRGFAQAAKTHLFEYLDGNAHDIALGHQAHVAITPMVTRHVRESDGKLIDLGYNPSDQSHSIDVPYLPPKKTYKGIPLAVVPTSKIMSETRKALGGSMGSQQKADDMISAFIETGAAEAIDERLRQGLLTFLINEHLDSSDRFDTALMLGALSVAIGTRQARKKSAVVVGFNIARLGTSSDEIALLEKIRRGVGVIKVVQNTDAMGELGMPPKAKEKINQGYQDTLTRFSKKGGIVSMVPSASANKLVLIEGEEVFVRPRTRPSVTSLAMGTAVLPAATLKGDVSLGSLHVSSELPEDDKNERIRKRVQMVGESFRDMAVQSARLSGIAIVFETTEKNKVTKKPVWMKASPNGEVVSVDLTPQEILKSQAA